MSRRLATEPLDAVANSAPTDLLRACPFARSRWASGADPAQQARERDGRPGPVKLSRLGRVAQARLDDAAREGPCCGVARLPPSSRDANHTSRRIQRVDDPEMMLTGVTMRVAIKQVCYSLHAIGAEVSLTAGPFADISFSALEGTTSRNILARANALS